MTVNAMSLCLLGCFKKNLKRQQDSLISEGCNALDSFESQLENNNKHLSTHDRALPKIPDNCKTNCCTKDEDDEEEENDSLYDIISKSRKKQNVNYKSDYKLKNSGRSKKNKLGAKKGFNDCEDVKNAEEIENTSQIQETSNCESIIKHDTNDKIKNDHRKLSPEPHSTKNNDATNNPITTKAGNDTNNFPSQSTSPSLSLLPSGPFQYTINNHHHHFYHHQPGRLSKINNTNNDNNNINDTLACVNTTNISNIGDDFISNNVHTDNLNQITSNNVLQMYPANNEIYAYPQLNNVSNRNSRRFQNYNTNETNILQTDQNIYRPPYNNTTSQIQSNTHTSTTQNIQPFDHRPISSFPDYSSVTARESLENLRKRERELAGTKCIKRGSNSGVRNVNMRAIEEGGEETYDTINYDLIKQASRKAPDHLYSTTGSDLYAEIETGQSSSRSSMYARVSDVLPPTPVSPSQTLFEGAITPQNSTHPLQSTSSQAWQLQCRPSYHEEGLQKRLPLSINNPSFTPNRVASFMEFSAGNSTSESKNNDGRSHFWTSILGTAVFKDNDNSAIFNNKFQKRSSSTRNEINTVDNFNSNRRNSNTNDLTDIVENLKNRRLYHHYSIPHLNMPIYSKVNKDKSKPSRENDYDVVNDDQDAKGGTDDDSTMQNNRNNNKNNNNNNNINNDKNIDKNNSPVCTPKYNFDSGYARIADIPDNINYSNNIKNNKINNNKNNDNNNNKENDKDNRFSVSSLYESVAESYEYIPNNNENNSHHNTNNNSNNKNNNRNLTVYLNKKEDYVIKPYHTVKIRSFEDKKNVKIIPSVFINNNNNNKFNNNDKTNTPNKINRLILRNHNEKRLKIADVGRNGKHPTDRDRHNNNNDEDINRISLGRSCFYVDNNDQLTNNSTDKSIDSNNSLLNPTKSAAKFTQTSKPSKSPLQSKSTFFIASNRITSSLEQPLPPQPPASMISTQSTLPQPQLKQNHLYHHRVCYPSNKFTVLPLPSSSTSPSSPPSSLSSSSSSSSAHQVLSLNPQRFKKFHIYDEVKDSPINSTNATKNNNNNNNITKQNNNNNNLKTLSEMPNDIDHNDPETDV